MSTDQHELFQGAQGAQAPHGVLAPRVQPEPAPVWLQRLSLVVLVIFCFYIGGLLVILPWYGGYWRHNGWMMAHPMVNQMLQHGWVRGLVSGVGLIDVWIGISEMIHYRDYRV